MRNKVIILFLIILLISIFPLTGCSGDNPEKSISLYSEYIKNGQYDKIYDILSKDSLGGQTKEQYVKSFGIDQDEDKNAQIWVKSLIKYFDLKPIDSQIDGNEAIVKTEVTMPNLNKIFADILPDLFALAFTDENMDEAANELLLKYLKENTIETITATKDIRLVQEDGWKIDTSSFELFDFPDLDTFGEVSTEEGTATAESKEIEATAKEDPNELDSSTSIGSTDEVNVEEQTLLSYEGIVITLKSLGSDSFWGPSLKVLVENNGDENVTVQIHNSAINNVMIEGMFSCDVAAGKKANDEITFMSSELETAKIDTIKDIEFSFHIFNSESWDTIYDSETIFITTTTDDSFTQSYDDSGFVALDNNGFKIVIKKLDSEESFWGADIYLYVENNCGKNATIQLRDTSINGFMVDPMFSCDVLSGKKAFDSISFFESDLEDNNIENINEMEFYFHIFESDGWDTIFDSDLIKVNFND